MMRSSGPRSLGLAPRTEEEEDREEDAGCAEDEDLRSHSEKQISQRRLTNDAHEQCPASQLQWHCACCCP